MWRAHEVYLLLAVLCVPTIVMSYSYGSIIREVTQVVRQRDRMTNSIAAARREQNSKRYVFKGGRVS